MSLKRRPCRWCAQVRDICPDCTRRAEDTTEPWELEQDDPWGRDQDWNWPRGWGDPRD